MRTHLNHFFIWFLRLSLKIDMKILILNGPNLNLLGKREPEIYGTNSFEDFFNNIKLKYPEVNLEYYQSNVEGDLINQLHKNGFKNENNQVVGIIFNPGGYSHTSVALTDAIASIEIPVIEVHISNVHAREDFRQQLLTARNCKGIIAGFGLHSYTMAIEFLIQSK
jgi:3-dehydroquinate dehydratase-2